MKKLTKLISLFALMLASGVALIAAPGSVSVRSIEGKVVLVSADGSKREPVAGDIFRENTRLTTNKNSSAKIVLGNGTVIVLEPNTTLDVSRFDQINPSAVDGADFLTFKKEPEASVGSKTTVRLVKGTAFFKVAKLLPGSELTVKTHAGDIGVKGTTFYVTVNEQNVIAGCIEGGIEVTPSARSAVRLNAGRSMSLSSSGTLGFSRIDGILVERAKSHFGGEDQASGSGEENDRISSFTDDPIYAYTSTVTGDLTNHKDRPGTVNSAASVGTR